MSVRAIIIDQLSRVAQEQEKPIAVLEDDTRLLDSGLDSLCFAVAVARLEDLWGVDPFSAMEEAAFPTTVGDFIALYERVVPHDTRFDGPVVAIKNA